MIDNYLTTEQVAKILQVHPFTILKFIKNGKIKGVKIGRVYRINENDVKDFLENMTVNSSQRTQKEFNKNSDTKKNAITKEIKDEKIYELREEKEETKEEEKEVYII